MKNILFLFSIFLSYAVVSGQETDNEPVYELSPFEVSTSDDGSYIAKNALSATKFDTALKDIPASVQVMTEAFLEDTFSLDLESAMDFSAAVNFATNTSSERDAGTRETGQFSIRGFPVQRVQRDGIRSLYSQDLTNVSRVEVMKGPASLLYGEVQPGGIINYIPKRPQEVSQLISKVTAGSDAFFRGEVEATGPLVKGRDGRTKLLYRIDASYEEEDGWKRSEKHVKRFVSPVLEWRIMDRMKLSLQYENHNNQRQTTRGFRSYSTFTQEMFETQRAIEDELIGNGSITGYSEVVLGLISDGSNLEQLSDALGTGSYVPVNVVPQEDGRYKVVNLNNALPDLGIIPNIYPQNPHLYATEENGQWFLVDDPRLMVGALADDGSARVFLRRDALLDLPYDFAFNHPQDKNIFKRDFYSVDFQTALPWDNWHLRINSVYDLPKIQVAESRIIGSNQANNGLISRNSAFAQQRMENRSSYTQFNLTGKWELFNTYNQTIIGGEYRHDSWFQETIGIATPIDFPVGSTFGAQSDDPALNQVLRDMGLYFDFFNSQLPEFFPEDTSLAVAASINTSRGLYASNLSSFFNDKMKLLLGFRWTENVVRRYQDIKWESKDGETDTRSAVTPQYGLIYALNEEFSFYISYTESFFPDGGQLRDEWNPAGKGGLGRFDPGSTKKPFEGTGKEFGVKLDLFDSKLSGNIAFFEIDNQNVPISEEVIIEPATGEILSVPSTTSVFEYIETQNGAETARGIDVDLLYSPTNSLQIVLGYAYIESETQLQSSVFEDAVGIPDHQVSIWTRYSFSEGELEGLSVGLGVLYSGDMRIFRPLASPLAAGTGDTAELMYNDAFVKFDMNLSYRTTILAKDTTFALNVKNITNEKQFRAGGIPYAPRQIYGSVKISF